MGGWVTWFFLHESNEVGDGLGGQLCREGGSLSYFLVVENELVEEGEAWMEEWVGGWVDREEGATG